MSSKMGTDIAEFLGIYTALSFLVSVLAFRIHEDLGIVRCPGTGVTEVHVLCLNLANGMHSDQA